MKILRAVMVAVPCAAVLGAAAWLIGTEASAPHRDGRGVLDFATASRPMGTPASFADMVQVIKPAVIGVRTKAAEDLDAHGLASPMDRFGQFQPPKTEPPTVKRPRVRRPRVNRILVRDWRRSGLPMHGRS
jgi:hypothetical protein